MKHIYFQLTVVILFFVFLSCHNKQKSDKKQTENTTETKIMAGIPEIDLLKKYPTKEINLQDIAEVTYIPFETNDKSLINAGNLKYIHWQDSTIITYRDKVVHLFNNSGKFINSFNHQGGGKGEYQHIQDMAADFKSGEIYIYDFVIQFRILVYSFNGEYKRTLKLPSDLALDIFNYDTKFLVGADTYSIIEPKRIPNKTPYSLISKETGEVTPLPIKITERIGKRCFFDNALINFDIEPIITTDSEKVIISDFSVDTVYSLRNRILTPIAIRKNRTASDGFPILSAIEAVSDKYILWGVQKQHADLAKRWMADKRYLLFDRQNGEITEVQFTNSDFQSISDVKNLRWAPSRYQAVIPENYIIQPLNAGELIERYNQGHLNGRLKEIASKLQEEDNPVLTLIKLK